VLEGVEDEPLLSRHRRAGDEHRPIGSKPLEPRSEARDERRCGGLELEISGHLQLVERHAQRVQPVAIERALQAEPRDAIEEQAASQRADRPLAAERAVGEPAVDHHHGHSPALRLAQDERPVVTLDQHQGARTDGVEEAAHGEAELERQIAEGRTLAERAAGAFLSGRRDGGDDHGQIGGQAAQQRLGDADFAHRDGMDPERAAGGRRQPTRHSAGQRGGVVTAPQRQERRSCERQQERRERLVESPHRAQKASIINSFQSIPVISDRRSLRRARS